MFKIVGKYKNNAWEELDSFDTYPEAIKMLSEYIMAYGQGWKIDIKRAK